jgi:hypothetical protein
MAVMGSYWTIYRGTVSGYDASGNILVIVPQLGTGANTGPWEWIGTTKPAVGDRVLLGSPSQQFDDLVIIGVLHAIVAA